METTIKELRDKLDYKYKQLDTITDEKTKLVMIGYISALEEIIDTLNKL